MLALTCGRNAERNDAEADSFLVWFFCVCFVVRFVAGWFPPQTARRPGRAGRSPPRTKPVEQYTRPVTRITTTTMGMDPYSDVSVLFKEVVCVPDRQPLICVRVPPVRAVPCWFVAFFQQLLSASCSDHLPTIRNRIQPTKIPTSVVPSLCLLLFERALFVCLAVQLPASIATSDVYRLRI